MDDSSKVSSAGTEWELRSWYTTTEDDRVTLMYAPAGDRFAVMYSYAWPQAPQLIEYADRSDAVRTYVMSREGTRKRGELATVGADIADGGE
ncbi:hypothetical protein ABZY09_30695 [Streptomyces sp. NPDC002928]|uniref:hypothetical protein n=1 Tax=Streptomyces sp. NPDC002928 TaxID=3154440 RepID=UPI0033B34764